MCNVENQSATTAMMAEENRKITEATTVLTSEEIRSLDDSTIAIKLFYLIKNGTDKDVNDFQFIAKCLHSFAIQLINQKR